MRNLVLLHGIHLGIPTQASTTKSANHVHRDSKVGSRQPIPLVRLEYRIPTKHLVPTRRHDLALRLPLEQDRLGRRVLSGRRGRVGERTQCVGAVRGESLEEGV